MKKTIMMVALAAMFCLNANAQRNEQMSEEEREKAQAERVQKQAEKLAKDMELTDEQKTKFVATYTEYQTVLAALRQNPQKDQQQVEPQQDRKKEMTDEEATAQIEKSFERQEEQIKQMQQRLTVDKAYYAEFQKTLSPKQLIKIFGRRSNRGGFGAQGQRGQMGGQMGGPRGGFGGQGGFPGGNGGDF